MEEYEELRRRATQVKQRLTQRNLSRSIFVEFSGTPKSGKSTCIDILAHFFRRLDFKVLAPTEGASQRTPYYLKENWLAFNTWSASYALMHVLEGLYGSDKYDLAILDRGLFDALAWFELLQKQEKITHEERDIVHAFLRINEWRSVIDAVFMFRTDPETSLERENQNKLITEPGSTMNHDILSQLNSAYDTVKDEYASEFSKFEIMDTSKSCQTTANSTAADTVGLILDIFESKVAECDG